MADKKDTCMEYNLMIIERIANLVGNNEFVCDSQNNKWYSYDELWEKAYKLSLGLIHSELDGFVTIMENGIDLFFLYFAAMLANKTIVPLDPRKSEVELNMILSENSDKLIVRNYSDLEGYNDDQKVIPFDKIIEAIKGISIDKEYMVTYTSGSTGKPKGVSHSLRNLFMAADSFGNAVGLGVKNTMCHVMPMSYMAGILNTIFMPFLRGSKIVILPRFDVMSAVSFWHSVERFHVDSFWLSPTMLNILMAVDRRGDGKHYLESITPLFFIGTAPLFETVREKFENLYDVRLLQSYGLSETLFLSTEVPDRTSETSAVGYVLPEVQLSFGDDGEIAVNVPWMFSGYTNDETEKYFKESSYLTGDIGCCKNGVLSITGRVKDLIIKGGMNISPKSIEDCILKHCEINECAVAGVVINEEERIVCWYSGSNEKSAAEMNEYIENELGKHCCVDYVIKIQTIPKNENYKPDKKRLVEEYRNANKI